MKKIISLIFVILIIQNTYSQDKNWKPFEIFMFSQGLDGDSVRYKMSAKGTVWDSSSYGSVHSITNEYDLEYYPILDSLPEPDLPQNWGISDILGFNRAGSEISGYPIYGYGLYEMSVLSGNAYFYIDYRDTEVGIYPVPVPADIWIMYNDTLGSGSNGRFYYSATGQTNLDTSYWTGINNGEYLEFWKIKSQSKPEISDFESYWSNALCLVEQNNHPLLVWGPHPTIEYVEHYNLYRKKSTEQNFSEIYQTEDDDTTYFLDEDIDILTGPYQQNEISAYYYVTASYIHVERLNESNPTDTVVVERAEGEPLKKLNGKQIHYSLMKSKLFRNYPNPFNPKTNIEYTIFEESFVKVDIYNALGMKILTLEDGYKSPGTYKLIFDGTKFSSGVYFYRIKAGSFNAIKKIILMK